MIDFAESQLQSLIKSKNPGAIYFYLKTKGKHRGYIEKYDIQGNLKIDELPYNGGIYRTPRKYDA